MQEMNKAKVGHGARPGVSHLYKWKADSREITVVFKDGKVIAKTSQNL